jgi:hypothetical protein
MLHATQETSKVALPDLKIPEMLIGWSVKNEMLLRDTVGTLLFIFIAAVVNTAVTVSISIL